MPTILHSRPLPSGERLLVVETTPPTICHWYESRRLDLVLTSAEPYTRINGRSVIDHLLRQTFADIRSKRCREIYERGIADFVASAQKAALDMTKNLRLPLPGAPADSHELTIDDINAMGLARRSAS